MSPRNRRTRRPLPPLADAPTEAAGIGADEPAPGTPATGVATPEGRYGHHGHWAPTAYGARRKANRVGRMFDWFVGALPPNATLVEIGPGRGELADLTQARGVDYVGVEPSAELCATLRARGFDVICASVPPIPGADGSADVVYSVDVFEHFQSYREAMETCLEAGRVLTPGGLLVIVAPNVETLGKLFYQYEYQHAFVTNEGRLEEMVRDAGFEVVESRAFLTTIGLSRLWPIDRVLTHVLIPVARSSLFVGAFRILGLRRLLFRVHKVLCDHIGVVARKPAGPS